MVLCGRHGRAQCRFAIQSRVCIGNGIDTRVLLAPPTAERPLAQQAMQSCTPHHGNQEIGTHVTATWYRLWGLCKQHAAGTLPNSTWGTAKRHLSSIHSSYPCSGSAADAVATMERVCVHLSPAPSHSELWLFCVICNGRFAGAAWCLH